MREYTTEENVSEITDAILESYRLVGRTNNTDGSLLPSKSVIGDICEGFLQLVFPGVYGEEPIYSPHLRNVTAHRLKAIPIIPSNKLSINAEGQTSVLLLRVGESQQGVVGLQKTAVTGELEPGLSVRYMGTDDNSIASHLVTRYFSASVLTEDAIARLDSVSVNFYHEYVYPTV